MATVKLDIQVTKDKTGAITSTTKDLKALDDQANRTKATTGELADAVGKTATTMARSASVFGLNADALRAVDDAADIAELGMKNLSTAAAGFNTASVGVIGAGLAIGAMLGSWIRDIPGVAKAVDALAESLFRLAGVKMKDTGWAPGELEKIQAGFAGVTAARIKDIDAMHREGKTAKEIEEILKNQGKAKKDAVTQHIEDLKKEETATEQANKAAEAWIKSAEVARVAWDAFDLQMKKMFFTDSKAVAQGIKTMAEQNVAAAMDVLKTYNIPLGGNRFTSLLGPQVGGHGAAFNEDKAKADAEKMQRITEGLMTAFQGLTYLAEALGGAFGTILKAGIGGAQAGMGFGQSIMAALNKAGPAGAIIGAAVGGIIGIFSGIFGNAKKKAEELKKKQTDALNAFGDLYKQWEQARKELASTGLSGLGAIIEHGTAAQLTHAGEYLAATFEMLRKSGMSTAQALQALMPSIDELTKKGVELTGPLAAIATAAMNNKDILAFQEGLGQMASALAGFGLFTQDLANQISTDLGASIQGMVDAGVDYQVALALSAQDLYNLQQAALKSGTTLDEHTQKMIDDAEAAGMFADLEDPMSKLVEIQNAMLVATGELVKLFGGSLPAAVQKLIDTFNNAGGGGGGGGSTTTGTTPPPTPETPHFAAGGLVTRPTYALIGESGPEMVVPIGRSAASATGSSGAGLSLNYTPTFQINGSGLSRRELVSAINEINRSNEGAAVTRMKQALASR